MEKDIESCYKIAAKIVHMYGKKYMPILKRLHLERERIITDRALLKMALLSIDEPN